MEYTSAALATAQSHHRAAKPNPTVCSLMTYAFFFLSRVSIPRCRRLTVPVRHLIISLLPGSPRRAFCKAGHRLFARSRRYARVGCMVEDDKPTPVVACVHRWSWSAYSTFSRLCHTNFAARLSRPISVGTRRACSLSNNGGYGSSSRRFRFRDLDEDALYLMLLLIMPELAISCLLRSSRWSCNSLWL